jgi:acetyl-CoA carboxylase carboxyltransferase component
MGEQNDRTGSTPGRAAAVVKDTASTRLQQLKQQIGPQTSSRRQKKAKVDDGPADWSDVREEFDNVREMAQTPKSDTTGYRRQKEGGKLWVRERVELLLDKGSFREVGSTSGTATWARKNPSSSNPMEAAKEKVVEFTPSNNVQG